MDKEFPNLEPRDYQKEFLSDWWSENKLFRGKRGVGKTTLMLCEARRFSEAGFDILFLSPSEVMSRRLREMYKEYFGEQSTFDFGNYYAVEKGRMRGFHKDVLILDEFQNITLETYNQELAPMNPSFVRASACMSSMQTHWLRDAKANSEIAMFDSIYDEY